MTIFDQAKDSAKRNRPVPFWSWNDKLSSDECCHQIDLMNEQGIGGFFMHARGGLHTEYLSDEWFQVTKACVNKARELGMNAWAYDENGWPSGFGGGLVNAKGLFYQQKYLRYKYVIGEREFQQIQHPVACYTDQGKLLPEGATIPDNARSLICYFDVNPYYVDTLDGRVIAEFLQSTHQKYFEYLTEEERKTMRGFFTDEPQISRNGLPWSYVLEEAYQARFGEALRPRLPQLFFDWGLDYRRTRYRYWRVITELFSQNFMKQIHDWCEAHDWELTGHLVLEESLHYQLTANGACMPHYEYFSIPGMDILGRNHSWITLPLQLFSVAAQTGKRQILSETFALCGWAVSFADLQWLVQWQFVHGVNLICQHLEGYSLRGIRKRDYPASLFRHQPWWEYYKPFNDYLSRMGTLLEAGDVNYEVLLMHPISTAQMCYNDSTNGAMELFDKAFKETSDFLESHQINHHYGDEILMERHGSVENGVLKIGAQSYRLVILPKLANLSSVQVKLLDDFASQGGIILGLKNNLDPMPFAVDGEVGAEVPLLGRIRWFDSMEELLEAIPVEFRPVHVVQENGAAATTINWTSRKFADFDGKPGVFHYFVNNARYNAVESVICVPGAGIEGYCTHSGELYPLPYTTDGKSCVVARHFAPAGDFALVVRDYPVASAPAPGKRPEALKLSNAWKLVKSTENLLTLDHCRCYAEGEKLFEHEYVLTINDALLAKEKENLPLALEFEFTIGDGYDFSKDLTLLLEHPERQKILVNGKEIANVPQGYFADPAFERISIGGAVQPGRNIVRLESIYHQDSSTFECLRAAKIFESERNKLALDSEVESIYLAGDFGVKTDGVFTQLSDDSCRYAGDFVLTQAPTEVRGDHLEECGLPFFAGSLVLQQNVELTAEEAAAPHAVEFAMLYGNVLEVHVNGRQIATITRPNYVAEIPAGLLKAGANEIRLKLVTSLRNMLGPHHLDEGDCHAVGPVHFYKTAGGPFTAHGARPWNDDFCFVRHGIR